MKIKIPKEQVKEQALKFIRGKETFLRETLVEHVMEATGASESTVNVVMKELDRESLIEFTHKIGRSKVYKVIS